MSSSRSRLDHTGATAAFDRALELAPDSPVLLFHYGSYLLNEAGDPTRGRTLLQAAARINPQDSNIAGQIAWAHFILGAYSDSITMCKHVVDLRNSRSDQAFAAVVVCLRAATKGLRRALQSGAINVGAELLELAVETVRAAPEETLTDEAYDATIYLASLAQDFSESADGYISAKSQEYGRALIDLLRVADPSNLDRQVGSVKGVSEEKGFAFVRSGKKDYFVHYRDLLSSMEWHGIEVGQTCVFTPAPHNPKGPRAEAVRLLE